MSDLDAIADELYGLRPDTFAAARDEQIKKARAEGRQPLARELGQLRRPTQSAWLINLLWRDQRDVMEQLFLLAEALNRAQAEASGADLRRLTAQRREVEGALLARARELAEEAGVTVSASMEREAQETLAAALAQPEVAEEVRTGRLVKPAAYAGFGTFPSSGIGGAPAEARTQPTTEPPREAKIDDLTERAAQRARERREAAERQVAEARSALEAAARTLEEDTRSAEAARDRERDLRDQVAQLQQQLRELQEELHDAERASLTATRRRDQSARAHEATKQAFDRAAASEHLSS